MHIESMQRIGSWRDVADVARTTSGMEPGSGEPSDEWKRAILLAEHSPIRMISFRWKWVDLPYWVSVHFTRHHEGIMHFVSTQRTDRIGIDRDNLPQCKPVTHECVANLQALINIARVRLCNKAAKETRDAFEEVVKYIRKIDPIAAYALVPNCVYRGGCTEMKSCGRKA